MWMVRFVIFIHKDLFFHKYFRSSKGEIHLKILQATPLEPMRICFLYVLLCVLLCFFNVNVVLQVVWLVLLFCASQTNSNPKPEIAKIQSNKVNHPSNDLDDLDDEDDERSSLTRTCTGGKASAGYIRIPSGRPSD